MQKRFYYLLILTISIIIVRIGGLKAQDSSVKVSGTVTDAGNGELMAGVNISVKNTTTGTITGSNGGYTLSVPAKNDTLVFSFLGYNTQNIPINGRDSINAALKSRSLTGKEMVVVGYGTQEKEDVTGAISSVSSDELDDQPVTNLQGALEGKSAGIQITQNSGAPGSTAKVRIRGLTSINNSDPLYVVDGVPLASNNINTINPSNIASIQVLKDASAAAIYGSRGANGVVLIKTKTGKKGESGISVNTYAGVQQVHKKLDLLNSSNFVRLNKEELNNAGAESSFKKPTSAYTINTDWQDAIFRPAATQNYDLAFSGGSEDLTYRLSGGYLQQKGIITGSDYDRISLRLNSTFNPREDVEVGENISVAKSKQHNLSNGAAVILDALKMDPTVPVRDSTGGYASPRYSDNHNPLATINYNKGGQQQWAVVGNTYVKYKPIKGFSLKSALSIDLNFGDNNSFTPSYFVGPNFQNANPSVSHTQNQAFNWTWDNTATYETDFAEDHHIKILGGISQEKYSYEFLTGANQGQPGNEPYLRYLDAGINSPTVGGSMSEWALLSFIGRLNYNYKETYYLTATIRRDGSSKFGENNRFGNFPSASVGWVLTNEPFIDTSSNFLSYLKLRTSWGVVGNQSSAGYYDYSSTINNSNYAFGKEPTAKTAAEPGGLGNPDLKWEEVHQWDLGLDYRLFNDKLTGSIDYYHKKTEGMLYSIPILFDSGYTTGPLSNLASMLNSGIEFSADYSSSFSQDATFNAGVNFATLHNEILSLKNKGAKIHNDPNLTVPGRRVAGFYGYVTDGIFQNWDEVYNYAYQSQKIKGSVQNVSGKNDYQSSARNSATAQAYTAPGDIRFKDLNGDGVINSDDKKFLGTPIPKISFGFHIGGNFKNFDLNASFSGVYGNKNYQTYKLNTYGYQSPDYNMQQALLNRWHGEGTSNHIPRLNANDPNNNARTSNYFLDDASYLRLRTLTLGYTFPASVIPNNDLKKLRIYLSAQNLLTFTDYGGYDPEIGINQYGLGGGTLDLGKDNGTYPQSRTITIGINLSL